MSNRDELETRAEAYPPAVYRLPATDAIYPLDPEGGGTWIGANRHGLALCLLNASVARTLAGPQAWRSRGLLVRALLGLTTAEAVDGTIVRSDLFSYQPFRLVAIHQQTVRVYAWADTLAVSTLPMSAPLLFTSSTRGDAIADGIRRPLFETLVVQAKDSWVAGQRRFHTSSAGDDGAFRVQMVQPGLRTVSRCTVDLRQRSVAMDYVAFRSLEELAA